MPVMQGTVLAPIPLSATDGNQYSVIQGKQYDLICSELNGKYYTQNVRGNVAMASLTSAAAIIANATNAQPNFSIWNPAGNNKYVSLIRMTYGFAAGTVAARSIGYAIVQPAGATVVTGGPIASFTALTVRSGVLGQAYAGNVLAGSAASCTGTGTGVPTPTIVSWAGFSQGAPGTATTIQTGLVMVHEFDGTMILPPGVFWFPVGSAAAGTGETNLISAVWEELPFP